MKIKDGTLLSINNRPWTVNRRHMKTLLGDCYHQLRVIVIEEESRERVEVETLIHEILHALMPWANEDLILLVERDLTNALCENSIHFKKKWLDDD